MRTVTFDPETGDQIWSVAVPNGAAVAKPKDPELCGWRFLGWFDGSGVQWTFTSSVREDVKLTGKWLMVPYEEDGISDEEEYTEEAAPLQMMAATVFFMMMLRGGPKIVGTVTQSGKGLAGAMITYTLDERSWAVTADRSGKYTITVPMGSKVEIKSVNGRDICDVHVIVHSKQTELNIRV
ncbi:MAG: InlB B-repeat-containing protein [Methanomassiliicoccaceae archaeon]|jgi:hypothetical protein|nr:InlB B-repeat-containing protein [Methanomassiliicoccaceae archaeon]